MLSVAALAPVCFQAPVLPVSARSAGVRMLVGGEEKDLPWTAREASVATEEMPWTEEAGLFVVGARRLEKDWGDSTEIKDAEGLKTLAKKLNPAVGYWDPFGIGDTEKELHSQVRACRLCWDGLGRRRMRQRIVAVCLRPAHDIAILLRVSRTLDLDSVRSAAQGFAATALRSAQAAALAAAAAFL